MSACSDDTKSRTRGPARTRASFPRLDASHPTRTGTGTFGLFWYFCCTFAAPLLLLRAQYAHDSIRQEDFAIVDHGMVIMLNLYEISIGLALCSLAATAVAWAAQRENQRRRDHRLCQILRTAILSLEGVELRNQTKNLALEDSGTTGGERSF